MKTDKEYPATHSMETMWFAVDLDGNIALMRADQNGPVPYDKGLDQDSEMYDEAMEYYWLFPSLDEAPVMETNMFLYDQPLSPWFPMKRLNNPQSPADISSVPLNIRQNILRIPLRFRDSEFIQLAQLYPSRHYNYPEYEVDGERFWYIFNLPDGKKAFINCQEEPKIIPIEESAKHNIREHNEK